MGGSARDQVREILAETARRREIWALMQVVAHEALRAVTAEARRRGIRGQNWMGGRFASDSLFVSFPTYALRMAELVGGKEVQRLSHAEREHSFQLHGTGTLQRPERNTPYEGYPDLVPGDVQLFRVAAVEALMAALNEHITHIRRDGSRRR